MCIVIDVNTLASVFNAKSTNHIEFFPIKKWIYEGKGFLVYGGTGYKQELARTSRYLKLILEMRKGGKAILIKDSAVDACEAEIRKKTKGKQCDDQHIIALLGASRCLLLCSGDKRSFKFIRDRRLYPRGMPRVKVYRSSKHVRLLVPTSKDSLTNVE